MDLNNNNVTLNIYAFSGLCLPAINSHLRQNNRESNNGEHTHTHTHNFSMFVWLIFPFRPHIQDHIVSKALSVDAPFVRRAIDSCFGMFGMFGRMRHRFFLLTFLRRIQISFWFWSSVVHKKSAHATAESSGNGCQNIRVEHCFHFRKFIYFCFFDVRVWLSPIHDHMVVAYLIFHTFWHTGANKLSSASSSVWKETVYGCCFFVLHHFQYFFLYCAVLTNWCSSSWNRRERESVELREGEIRERNAEREESNINNNINIQPKNDAKANVTYFIVVSLSILRQKSRKSNEKRNLFCYCFVIRQHIR